MPKKILKISGLILFALVFYFAGYLIGHKNLVFEANYKPKITNKELVKPREVDFGIFWKTWETIQNKYVGESNPQAMVYGAISGLVDSLKDPYSSFMEPDFSKTFLEDLSGSIEGIGAEISVKDNQLMVVSPISGSPAEKVGLKPNDQILKIDDISTEGLSIEEAIQKIRGKAGTKVTLSILRDGWSTPQDFTITREKVTVKSVEWEMKEGIGYIKISQFGDDTVALAEQAATEIAAKQPAAVILDLRHNPGGYLETAVGVTSFFVDQDSVVVKEKYKDGHIDEEKTASPPILRDYKLIVLVDGGSASASEIVAGALQDAGRATLVGEKTFGKGSVQELEDLSNGATLRLTIAKWLTPKGRAIDDVGIEPDIKVELTEEDVKNDHDPQLDRALELAK